MGEMSLESLHVSYSIPRSISLERAGENDKPSHPPPDIVTMHPDFFYPRCETHFPSFSQVHA